VREVPVVSLASSRSKYFACSSPPYLSGWHVKMTIWALSAVSSRIAWILVNLKVSVAVSTSSRTTNWRSFRQNSSANAKRTARWSCSFSPPDRFSMSTGMSSAEGRMARAPSVSLSSWTLPIRGPAILWSSLAAFCSSGYLIESRVRFLHSRSVSRSSLIAWARSRSRWSSFLRDSSCSCSSATTE